MPPEQLLVIFFNFRKMRHRHKQVCAVIIHLALHVSFFPSRVGIAYIGSNLENAIWEEFGTGKYVLHGNGRKGGCTYRDEKGKYHHTYGKLPNRPLYKAFTALKNKIIKRAEEVLKAEMK